MGVLGEELRLEILVARVAAARVHHPAFDVPAAVLAHIAKSVANNGRDLEGALNRLLAVVSSPGSRSRLSSPSGRSAT
jgi:chromosomal replication initiator protein